MNNNKVFLTISEQIANQIRREIITGALSEGEALKEIELSKKYKVSRGPVRDALKSLSKGGFLISKPNVGVKVASHPGENVLSMIIAFRKQIELFVIVENLELYTDEDFIDMEHTVENLRSACESDDIYSIIDYDLQFHKLIVQKHEDKHLLELWTTIVNRMMLRYTRLDNLMDCYTEHRTILNAIKKCDKEVVLTLLEKNIQ
ncbi:MAG: GntR family transcriptional regulator [Spirochaetaceae bacterium]